METQQAQVRKKWVLLLYAGEETVLEREDSLPMGTQLVSGGHPNHALEADVSRVDT